MLGPVDIEDWSSCEEDRLRAEIRLLPLVQRFNRQPREVALEVGRGLADQLAEFGRNLDLSVCDLNRLKADLEAR